MTATLSNLTPAELVGLAGEPPEHVLALWSLCPRHPFYFLEHFCYTADQHDMEHPIKRFPIDRPYLRHMTQLWIDNPLLVVVKSRQMIMTWLFTALYLWDAMFHNGRLIMFQSKREEDAIGDETSGDGMLGRAKFMVNHIPYRDVLLPERAAKGQLPAVVRLGKRILFPRRGSTLWAIPQGPSIIRQRTASGYYGDESGFQPEAEDAYAAMRPTIRGGGRATFVTTAGMVDKGFTRRLYEDRLTDMEAA